MPVIIEQAGSGLESTIKLFGGTMARQFLHFGQLDERIALPVLFIGRIDLDSFLVFEKSDMILIVELMMGNSGEQTPSTINLDLTYRSINVFIKRTIDEIISKIIKKANLPSHKIHCHIPNEPTLQSELNKLNRDLIELRFKFSSPGVLNNIEFQLYIVKKDDMGLIDLDKDDGTHNL